MTCVLAMRTVYNRPCLSDYMKQEVELHIPEVGARSGEDCGINWVSTSSSGCSGYGVPEARSGCSGYGVPEARSRASVCRVEVSSTSFVTLGSRSTDISSCPSNSETLNGMCNTPQATVADQPSRQGVKRKAEFVDPDYNSYIPPKRVSPFLNTPKERKEELKKVLKISIQKLKQVEDPEHFLRRSVLVNNTMKKLQTELREVKMNQTKSYSATRRKERPSYGALNNNCLSNSYLFDDPFLCDVYEKITDDMTDTLVSNLQDKLVDSTSDTMVNKADNVGSTPATSACSSSAGTSCRTSNEIRTVTVNSASMTNQRITSTLQRFETESNVPDVIQCNRVTGPSLVAEGNDRLKFSRLDCSTSQSNEFNGVPMCDSSTTVNDIETTKLRQWTFINSLCEGGDVTDIRKISADDSSNVEDISHILCSIDSLTDVSQSKSAAESQNDLSLARPSAALPDSIMGLDGLPSITMKDFILAQ